MPETVFLDILPNVDGFKLSVNQFKGLANDIQIRHCKLKSMHVWQLGSLGNIGRMVREKAMDMTETFASPLIYSNTAKATILLTLKAGMTIITWQ